MEEEIKALLEDFKKILEEIKDMAYAESLKLGDVRRRSWTHQTMVEQLLQRVSALEHQIHEIKLMQRER